jgi:hypothetical protein
MITKSVISILKYELLFLSRTERTKGFLIYFIGLPIITYIITLISGSSDSTIGVGVLSICMINILYGPLQFSLDRNYYEGLFSRNIEIGLFIRAKMIFLQTGNILMYLSIIPLIIIFYDVQRIFFISSFFFFCFGFASPLIILLSGLSYKTSENTMPSKITNKKIGLKQIAIGLLPFLPELLLIIGLSSRIWLIIILNIFLGLLGLFLSSLVNKIVKRNIMINRHFVN